mmetsp:Transcript_3999/g.4426  ORF Transcript_3999/g.4426 Transcript_3999/m.4426 type:complete len:223 (+) Transcript_3999:194-862(+)
MAVPAQVTYSRSEEYLAFKDQMLTEALNVFSDATWTVKKQKKGFTSRKRDTEILGHRLRGCVGDLDIHIDTLMKMLTDPKVMEIGYNIDREMITETKILEHVDEFSVIVYQVYKMPFPMKNRYLTTMVAWKRVDDGQIVVNSKSLKHKDTPVVEKLIEMEMPVDAFLLKPQDGKVYTQYAGHYDPCGSVPEFVKEMIGSEQYGRLALTADGYRKMVKKGIAI